LLIWDDQFVVGLMGSAQGQQANQPTNVTDKTKPLISFKRKLIEVTIGFFFKFSLVQNVFSMLKLKT